MSYATFLGAKRFSENPGVGGSIPPPATFCQRLFAQVWWIMAVDPKELRSSEGPEELLRFVSFLNWICCLTSIAIACGLFFFANASDQGYSAKQQDAWAADAISWIGFSIQAFSIASVAKGVRYVCQRQTSKD